MLERVKDLSDERSWARFNEIYRPLIARWARRHGCHANDAADVAQEVLIAIAAAIQKFNYDRGKSFKSWMMKITHRKILDRLRKVDRVQWIEGQIEPQAPPELEAVWDEEWRKAVGQELVRFLEHRVSPKALQIYLLCAIEGEKPKAAAKLLKVSVENVRQSIHRIREILRHEFQDGLQAS